MTPSVVPARGQIGGFYPLHAAAFHKEDCVGCARLLLAAGARLDVHWVRRPRSSRKHTHMCGHSVRSCVRQYTMTPLDYARWRNRTALAALLEAEATAQGLTNATRSDEPN